MRFLRSAISEGRLHGGLRVCSSRQLAEDFGVSRTTAIQAYQRLIDEGYLVTRPGAGVFVSKTLPSIFTLRAKAGVEDAAAASGPQLKVDMRNRQLPLAPGVPALDHFPWAAWTRISHRLCRQRPLCAIGYGDPQGELQLRETIVRYLAGSRGLVCKPSQVIVIGGTEQLMSFAARQITRPGDSAWYENPSYPLQRRTLRAAGLDPRPVRVDEQGLDVQDGERRAPDARLAIVSPTHQYPLGISMTLERRHQLIEWSRRTGAWILESEIDGDYRYTAHPLPPLYTLARGQRVIYCGSLTKWLAPGLRVNYLVAPPDAIESFVICSTTLAPMLTQLVLAELDREGYLASHMNKMRSVYAKRRSLLLESLAAEAGDLLEIARVPVAGLRVTARLRSEIDDREVAARCFEAGVTVDPLSACYAGSPGMRGLIVGFASTDEAKIPSAVRTLARAIRAAIATSPH